MNSPSNRFRSRMLLPCAGPLLVGVVVALIPTDGPVIPVALGVAFAVACASAGIAWMLSRPVSDLTAAVGLATGSGSGNRLPTDRRDELGAIAANVGELLDRIASLENRADRAEAATAEANGRTQAAVAEAAAERTKVTGMLDQLVRFLGAVANGTPTPPLALELPAGVPGDRVEAATLDLATKVNFARQKQAAFHRVLQATPMALVAIDDKGTIRFANTAAERALGRPTAEILRTPLSAHVRPPAGVDPTGLAPLPESGIVGWLGAGGTPAFAESVTGTPFALVGSRSTTPTDSLWCVTLRDLTEDHHRLGGTLARTREDGFATSLALADRAIGGSGESILAQTRQLIGDAKQTPQRDLLVPRLRSIQQSAGDLDAQARITRSLATVLWGELPRPICVEFLAGESVRSVVDQLAARLTARNATVSITDHGGWVYCDEEWFRTAIHGALAHATASVRDNPIGVKLRRLPCGPTDREGRLEIEIVDAGPALTPTDHAALTHPFGDVDPTGFVPAPGTDGFLPGLLLAGRMTAALGGDLTFGETASGRLVVRMVVPTRLPDRSEVPTDIATQPDVGHPEELCFGWKLGVAG